MKTTRIMHAFFSKQASELPWRAKQLFDGRIKFVSPEPVPYPTPDGRTVFATAIYLTKERGEEQYQWPDKVYLGEVLVPA